MHDLRMCIDLIWDVSMRAHVIATVSSDILVIKIILVLVLVSFQSNHFYFI